jgi:hypothetical protein
MLVKSPSMLVKWACLLVNVPLVVDWITIFCWFNPYFCWLNRIFCWWWWNPHVCWVFCPAARHTLLAESSMLSKPSKTCETEQMHTNATEPLRIICQLWISHGYPPYLSKKSWQSTVTPKPPSQQLKLFYLFWELLCRTCKCSIHIKIKIYKYQLKGLSLSLDSFVRENLEILSEPCSSQWT